MALMLVACSGDNSDNSEQLPEVTQNQDDSTPNSISTQEQELQNAQEEHNLIYTIVSAEDFNEGLAWVEVELEDGSTSWAVINTVGRIQFFIDAELQPRTPFTNGVALVTNRSTIITDSGFERLRTKIVDRYGNTIVDNNDIRFDGIRHLRDGYIWVQRQIETIDRSETEIGVLCRDGEWIHEFTADWQLTNTNTVWHSDGILVQDLSAFERSGSVYRLVVRDIYILDFLTLDVIFRLEGAAMTSFQYDYYADRFILITSPESSMGARVFLISRDGTYEMLPLEEGHVIMFSNISSGIASTDSALDAWRDSQGNPPDHFHDIHGNRMFNVPQLVRRQLGHTHRPRFEGEYCFVALENEGGVMFLTIIDRDGNQLFEPFRGYSIHGSAGNLSEGLVWIRDTDGNHVSINTRGEHVITVQANSVSAFKEGFAIVSIDGNQYFIDMDGNKLVIHS